jgi:stage II sporulation protein D
VALTCALVACAGSGGSGEGPRRERIDPTPAAAIDRPGEDAQDVDALLAHAAYEVRDLERGTVLVSARPERLEVPASSGSLMKIATLAAALDTGAVGEHMRLLCRRSTTRVDGRVLDCSHPGAGSPLLPAEALAHSCNSVFLSLAGRLSREQVSAARVVLGLPPVSPAASLSLAAVGLDGALVAPRAWPRLIARLARGEVRLSPRARRILLEGLEGATTFGTATALGDLGERVVAKTGTAPEPGGQVLGLVAAAWPAGAPTRTLVLLAPGAAGRDAAALAREVIWRLNAAGSRVATLRVGRVRDGRYEIERMPLEEYVAAVVGAEAPPRGAPALHEALAVIARTYGWGERGRHAAEGFDVCDLTHCQALARPTAASSRAAASTRGRVLAYGEALAEVYYSASCGGFIEAPQAIWPAAAHAGAPYLARRPDPAAHARDTWTSEIEVERLEDALRAAGLRGHRLDDARVVGAAASGRAVRVRVAGFVPDTMSAEDLRLAVGRALGWQVLKSTAFTIDRTARGYRFTGSGHGHGVGLCVRGAALLAGEGASLDEVLAAYFPGTRLDDLQTLQADGDGAIRVTLPSADEKSRPVAETAVRRGLAHVTSALAVPPPTRVAVRFHPTIRSYQRVTRQPWWTSGATVGGRIELPPLETLRRRGTLDRTIRHELVHLLTGEPLAGRPLWVREGLAAHVAGQGPAAAAMQSDAAADCPADAEFRRARSGDALRVVYERAARCVGQELARGTAWQQIGAGAP